jgi:hypothetical protein
MRKCEHCAHFRAQGGDVRHPDDKEVDQVKTLIDRISPILHGQDRQVQGAVLADLLARWLAGHCVPDDRFQTILMRGRILHQHMKIVRDLTKVNAMQIELESSQKEMQGSLVIIT